MTTIRTFIKRHAVLAYCTVTFVISWGAILMVVVPSSGLGAPEQVDALLPLVYLAMLAGPSLAGILLTGFVDGRAGLRDLGSQLLRWRVGVRWYAVALLTVPFLATAILLGLAQLSPLFLPYLVTAGDRAGVILSAVAVGLVVGICEELGWTGFAVPRLRQRYGILTTGIILGLVWGAWHFLVFWESDSFSALLPLALLLARLFSWLPAYRVLMVWVYDRSGSLLVTILMHASLVAGQFMLVPQALTGAAFIAWILAWAVALWIVVVVVAVANARRPARASLYPEMNVVRE